MGKLVRVIPLNSYLINIKRYIAYMPADNYIQWASKGPGTRFYVNRKGRGGLSIGGKNVIVLAQAICYMNDKGEWV